MASILRVNTLTDASSGNSTAMSTINQGTAKAWVQFNGSDTTPVPDGGFNTSSITDITTGQYQQNFTSNMANADYSTPTSRQWNGVACPDVWNTNYVKIVTRGAATTTISDGFVVSCAILGDLA
jgi:hypothetical protein